MLQQSDSTIFSTFHSIPISFVNWNVQLNCPPILLVSFLLYGLSCICWSFLGHQCFQLPGVTQTTGVMGLELYLSSLLSLPWQYLVLWLPQWDLLFYPLCQTHLDFFIQKLLKTFSPSFFWICFSSTRMLPPLSFINFGPCSYILFISHLFCSFKQFQLSLLCIYVWHHSFQAAVCV